MSRFKKVAQDIVEKVKPYSRATVAILVEKALENAWEQGARAMQKQVGVLVRYKMPLSDDIARLPVPPIPEEEAPNG